MPDIVIQRPQRFTALTSFESPEMSSAYVEGLSYTARASLPDDGTLATRSANAARDRLAALLPQWLAEGKVRLGDAMPHGTGLIAGSAVVGGGGGS